MLRFALIAAPVAALLVAGAAAMPTQRDPDVTIRMRDYTYAPEATTIRVGQTIEWSNSSAIVHTVTADPRRADDPKNVELPEGAEPFDSGEIQPRTTYRRRFTVPGTYKYFCIPHEEMGMVGTIVVEEAPETGD